MIGFISRLLAQPRRVGTLPPVPEHLYRKLRYTAVSGESHHNEDGVSRQDILKKLKTNDTVALVPEPDNPYSRHAVRIVSEWGVVGYISGADTEEVAEDLATRKIAPFGSIVSIHGGTKDKPNRGLVVQLYRRRKRPLPRPDES